MLLKPENANLSENPGCNHFIKVPLCFQENEYTCGVACVQSMLAGYGIIYRQDVLSEMLKEKPLYGTDYENMISFFEMLGFQAAFHSNMSIDYIKELLDDRITPILMIQAWKDDDIDYSYDWRDSHYVIACGYDENRILFMDPWTLGCYTFITNNELLKRWHTTDPSGNHYHNTGLIIKNENLQFVYSPSFIKRMG